MTWFETMIYEPDKRFKIRMRDGVNLEMADTVEMIESVFKIFIIYSRG